jgi:hypothetical protein
MYRSVIGLNELVDLRNSSWLIFTYPIREGFNEPINDTEAIMPLFSNDVVIVILFFRYFNSGGDTKAISSSDSNYFIFHFLKRYLRALRIEAVHR